MFFKKTNTKGGSTCVPLLVNNKSTSCLQNIDTSCAIWSTEVQLYSAKLQKHRLLANVNVHYQWGIDSMKLQENLLMAENTSVMCFSTFVLLVSRFSLAGNKFVFTPPLIGKKGKPGMNNHEQSRNL